VTILAGAAAGALWSLVPGVLRLLFAADEVVTTLMMNFVAVLLLEYLTGGPLKDPAGSGQTSTSRTIAAHLRLSDASGMSMRIFVIVAVVTGLVWLLLYRTPFGLRAALAGRNPVMARWQGVDPGRLGVTAFAIAGALAGVAGSLELLGPSGALSSGFSPDIGFVAVVVALVGGLSVGGAVAAALFFGGLHAAILYLPTVTNLPTSALTVLNGFVAMLITVSAIPALVVRRRRRRELEAAGA